MAAITRADIQSPVGLIAGNGKFPLEFAESAKRNGLSVVAVAHRGETEESLEDLVEHCCWVRVGEVGKLIQTFQKEGVRQAAFAGGIKRIKLFGGFKPDVRAVAVLLRSGSTKDDVLLREIAKEIEGSGISIFSASVLLERSVPRKGFLTKRQLSAEELSDARRGWEAAKGIGALDIGQTVVVHQGAVVAVEAIEGTDAAVLRAGELAGTAVRRKVGKGCVIVKLAKPQQDLRFDLPTVGLGTIEVMGLAGATALVLEAEKSIILDVEEFVRRADQARLAVVAVSSLEDLEER